MTSEGGPEPTLADVLAAINAVAATQQRHGEALAQHGETLAQHTETLERLALNFEARAELDESRHTEITQTLDALADLAHTHSAQLAGLPEDIGGDIRAAEARVTSRLEDLRRAVHALKTDFVRHTADPDAHHRHGNAA